MPKIDLTNNDGFRSENLRSYDPLRQIEYGAPRPPEDPREATNDERSTSFGNHRHNGSASPRIDVGDLAGFIEVVSAVPTGVPKLFWESVKIYSSGGTRRLYVYVIDSTGSGAWRYTALT